jgi:hypothetical protein
MAQGQLGIYGPCPTEIQPAAQRVKARVYDLGLDAPRPAENLHGRLGERGGAGRRRSGPGSRRSRAGAERSLVGMAEVHGYMQWTSREPAGGVMNHKKTILFKTMSVFSKDPPLFSKTQKTIPVPDYSPALCGPFAGRRVTHDSETESCA